MLSPTDFENPTPSRAPRATACPQEGGQEMPAKRKQPFKKITMKMMDAARLAAFGYTAKEISQEMGVPVPTVNSWIQDPGVQDEIRKVIRSSQIMRVTRAQRVLTEQMEERDAGKGFLSQNAANSILNRYEAAVMGEEQQSITINFTSGVMPVIGMPDSTDNDTDEA